MKILAALLLGFSLMLTSCAMLDKAVGTYEKPGPVENFVDGVGGLATGTPLAPITAGLSLLINLYQAVRGKKYRQAAEGVVLGIDIALEAGSKADVSKAELYDAIRGAIKEVADDASAVERIIAAIKAKERA